MSERVEDEKGFTPKPAESFQAEFLNEKGLDIQKGMSGIGFSFRRSGPEGNDAVTFEGERQTGDGTTIQITIKRGADYKSPAELAIANAEDKEGKQVAG